VPGGITGLPFSWGYKYRDPALQVGGLDARLTTLFCKIYCYEIQRSENQTLNVAESSEEGCDSKRAVLLMIAGEL
jgi:hypothetical protein